MKEITWQEFEQVELRIGSITKVEDFPEAHKPTYKLWIDFGEELGEKQSSSQIVDLYTKEELIDKQVVCVVNFPPKQVGPFVSEVLTTGLYREDGKVVLCVPEKPVPNGSKLL